MISGLRFWLGSWDIVYVLISSDSICVTLNKFFRNNFKLKTQALRNIVCSQMPVCTVPFYFQVPDFIA